MHTGTNATDLVSDSFVPRTFGSFTAVAEICLAMSSAPFRRVRPSPTFQTHVANSFLEFLANRSHNIPCEHPHTFRGIDSIFTILLVKDFAFTTSSVPFGRLIDSGPLP